MEWILKNLPLLIFVFVVISIVRSTMRAREAALENKAEEDETDEQRRVREIRERIRRRIEERSVGGPAQPSVLERPNVEPPFLSTGGAEANLAPVAPPPAQFEESDSAKLALERQARLAAEMEELEQVRRQAERRVLRAASVQLQAAAASTGRPSVHRAALLRDLRDRQNLRRAFILREVLGPPVGLP